MNFRFANIAAGAACLVMTLGYLIAGGNPNEHEIFLILMASFLTGGIALGLLAEKRDRGERREDSKL
jgi:hypothetical protein